MRFIVILLLLTTFSVKGQTELDFFKLFKTVDLPYELPTDAWTDYTGGEYEDEEVENYPTLRLELYNSVLGEELEGGIVLHAVAKVKIKSGYLLVVKSSVYSLIDGSVLHSYSIKSVDKVGRYIDEKEGGYNDNIYNDFINDVDVTISYSLKTKIIRNEDDATDVLIESISNETTSVFETYGQKVEKSTTIFHHLSENGHFELVSVLFEEE